MNSAPRCERCRRPHRVDLRCWHGLYAKQVRELAYRVHGRQCVLCRVEGRSRKATQIDHIIARGRGGGDELTNLQPVCAAHNQAKGAGKYEPPPLVPIAGNGQPVSSRFR